MMRPIIGITCDTLLREGATSVDYMLPTTYVHAVSAAGGVAVLLPHEIERIVDYLELCDGFVLAGGDDPDMTVFGEPVHDRAVLMDGQRQRFELALLEALDVTAHPVLGVFLGMQLMALHHGGRIDQHLPDTLGATAGEHDRRFHAIRSCVDDHATLPATGQVYSRHHQAVSDPGAMRVCGAAEDGVIEAIDLPIAGRFYLGVQWHPERTDDPALGVNLYEALCGACDRS